MKKISFLFFFSFWSLFSMAQLDVLPTFDSKGKMFCFTFTNTTQYIMLISQGTPSAGHAVSYFEMIFLDENNKEIARRESVFSWDKLFILKPNEQRKTQYDFERYGYQGIKKIKIEYNIIYSTFIEKIYKRHYLSDSVIFNWGN